MNTLAAAVLAVLAVAVVINASRGTLGVWLKAKFLHQAPPAGTPGTPT